MRIAVAQFFHESNTFSPYPTREIDFRSECFVTGETMFERWRDTDSEIAGFLDAAVSYGDEVELVPILSAWAWPSGPVADDVFVKVRSELLDVLTRERVDGVLLALHGACVTPSRTDADGDLLAALRYRIGSAVPMVATLDFHANLSPQMVLALDAVVGYKTYPHVDYRERGAQAMGLLVETIRHRTKPQIGYTQPPLLTVPQRQWTSREPMTSIIARAREMELDRRVLVANAFGGFAYSDSPHAGMSFAVVTRDDHELAQSLADELARLAWQKRREFIPSLMSVADAVETARESPDGLTVLVDVGDNVGGGTPGSGTVILAELLRQRVTNAAVVLADVEAVRECARVGVGSDVRVRVGGKTDEWHGSPVSVQGKVRMLFDGEFTNIGRMRAGIRERQGLTARLSCAGIELILTSRKMPSWNLEQLRAVGIEPTRLSVFVAKSAIAFRAAYEPIAARILEVDTPGLTSANLAQFPYKRLRRPIFPFDNLADLKDS
jgi:microcystin degradation protein MlrC